MRKLLVVPVIAGALIALAGLPASAQFIPGTIAAVASCDGPDGTLMITVTIDSPDVGGTTITVNDFQVTSTPAVTPVILDITPNPIPAGETGEGAAEFPGTFTGTISVLVDYQEASQMQVYEAELPIAEPCIAPGTTVTTAAPTTTAAAAVTVTPTFTG